jgi:hypothetical protein
MNTLGLTRLGVVALLCWGHIASATTVTFTNDTYIGATDLSSEGRDIIVTNCTLTVDGPHTFNSLQLLNSGVLTHSPFTNGPLQSTLFVARESHVMSATNPATLNNPNVDANTISVFNSSLTTLYTADVDYVITFSNEFAQLTLTTNSAIAEGASVLVNYDWTENSQGFFLAVSRDFTIAPGGALDISGKGYGPGNGLISGLTSGVGASRSTNFPFAFTAGGGGGHGGAGGMSSTFAAGGGTYDSTTEPENLGSGGGNGGGVGGTAGGAGGGAATVLIGRNFQVDGQIFANGSRATNAHSGGGAGGSLLISAETISGAGAISANGGSGDLPDGGGGGGGRIALYFATNNFAGNLSAFGGGGYTVGGAGTIYLQSDTDAVGRVLIVNGGKRGATTTFSAAVSDLTISGGAILQGTSQAFSVTNLFLGSNSWLLSQDFAPLTVSVDGDATVESNALINADFKSSSGSGVGSASCGAGSGSSYGGYGGTSVCGATGGSIYGSIDQPFSLGSPGPSGVRGGGAIKMSVAGILSLDGKISANGASAVTPNSGGGSGGSVWLMVGTLSGAGLISANGGSASNLVSGGGGGGRVAVYFNTNLFTGSVIARGGAGTNSGGPGSVYLKTNSAIFPQVIFDNGDRAGITFLPAFLKTSDLRISGGTLLTNYPSGPLFLRSLFIGSNSWFTYIPDLSASLTLTVTNVTIQLGGGIRADAASRSPSQAQGGGQTSNFGGGGGGAAGYGGAGLSGASGGLAIAKSLNLPVTAGGMGGGASGAIQIPGGFGGGVISLTVPGTLALDGQISANGAPGTNFNVGGGGGGSIRISARTISGTGTISANGGAGNNAGGGGSGGAIALYTDVNLFSGPITAIGGGGANFGGAGTFYLSRFTQPSTPQLFVDNGGNRGSITPLGNLLDISDLTIANGAVVSNTAILSAGQMRNLVIGSNSVLEIFANVSSTLNFSSNVTIFATGSLNADAANSFNSQGSGQTFDATGGGGGSAGTGGASALGAAGGAAISDIASSPVSIGGGRGGSGLNQASGGNGGGYVRVTIGGTLRVDGRISADGGTTTNLNGGGGAGGIVSLSTKAFSGNGIISANGNSGNAAGGGGGGGHIAVDFSTNSFTGNLTARGGGGANFGGAGIIYLTSHSTQNLPPVQLIVDNGGARGGFTPFFSPLSTSVDVTITGGAIFTNATPSFSLAVRSVFIGSNSTWLTSPQMSILSAGTNVTIQSGGALIADGLINRGLSPGQGLAGVGGGGGGAGGYGGASRSNVLGGNVTADSITSPTLGGSAGGLSGAFGGGGIQLTVSGNLQLDGKISADGATNPSNANSGGGSGGTVWIKTMRLFGTGSISANGGAANNLGGGGGGGRIAVWYNSNAFTGTITARGGAGANYGGAGTVFLNPSAADIRSTARLIVDNGGMRGTNTGITSSFGVFDVIVTNGGTLSVGLTTTPTWNNLTIASNSALTLVSNFTALHFLINSNLDIQAGGALMLDGQGSKANSGMGSGRATGGFGDALMFVGGGGGHGGYGSSGNNTNAAGGNAYDTIENPSQPGSGGGSGIVSSGSAGGGALQLTVNGKCTINGLISANGTPGTVTGAGGGSGGSVFLTAGILAGNGRIQTDGGSGDIFTSGGGGGGRIAVYFKTNQFTGVTSAHGGAGVGLAGGAGTIYWKTNLQSAAIYGQVFVDNGGLTGTNTPIITQVPPVALLIQNSGSVIPSPGASQLLSLQSLTVGSNSTFLANPLNPLTLTVFENAVVDNGGTIAANAEGFEAGFSGFGTGQVDIFGNGGGGGYGGAGGASLFGAAGGLTFGSSNQPVDLGGPGGVFPNKVSGFSKGGGAIKLTVTGALTVNGNISANGADGIIEGAGGGSGGSIWVVAQKLSGNGTFTANGGQGESFEGGGGGGGRIAIYISTNIFTGTISAAGGDGASPGQDGTIYIPTSVLISGNVTNQNGVGIAGILLQPTGMAPATSDTNGYYSVAVPFSWTGYLTPSGNGIVIPSARTFVRLTADTTNQNFLVATPSTFNLKSAPSDAANLGFSWYGITGVTYQLLCSSNMVDWAPCASPIVGGNAPLMLSMPTTNGPQMFYRLSVSY